MLCLEIWEMSIGGGVYEELSDCSVWLAWLLCCNVQEIFHCFSSVSRVFLFVLSNFERYWIILLVEHLTFWGWMDWNFCLGKISALVIVLLSFNNFSLGLLISIKNSLNHHYSSYSTILQGVSKALLAAISPLFPKTQYNVKYCIPPIYVQVLLVREYLFY